MVDNRNKNGSYKIQLNVDRLVLAKNLSHFGVTVLTFLSILIISLIWDKKKPLDSECQKSFNFVRFTVEGSFSSSSLPPPLPP